ncbi:MAG: excinuclease ABC subunit UvrB [Candidatus Tritonobacter lacicola]|nr:excinuclease ABC subunit UvrB [Candidatus Tritonobacter lacicola]
MSKFVLHSDFKPEGDQPGAIEKLVRRLEDGQRYQTLLGVTGSGKTFTIANAIERVQRPTLVVSHNKTLAAQLYSELKQFFPDNAVEYFVSYYDYYQPEAYIPQTDTYIEKDASINRELERLRLSATTSLLRRRDVIVVASVSCIYGVGSPEDVLDLVVMVKTGEKIEREKLLRRLVDLQYERNDIDFSRGRFRVRGEVLDVFTAAGTDPVRISFDCDRVEKIERFNQTTGRAIEGLETVTIYPAKHFVIPYSKLERAFSAIEGELAERLAELKAEGKLLEAQRIESRTRYDLEMLKELGYCQGIENYSRHLSGRLPGQRPCCLIDFFPPDSLFFIDESHATLPQLRGMYKGDRSRKLTLVEHGFRLPSALDNRPLNFEEFDSLISQVVFISATPGPYELSKDPDPAEQVIRPTGLIDPGVTVCPLDGQVDDLIERIRGRVKQGERVLVTTLTKRMSENLTDYLAEIGIKVKYIHSEIDAIERVELLRGLRAAEFDVLVGINLLREGLDLPEVSLVAILDADKEGFLRSHTSLIQTAGRAARNVNGEVVLYADQLTDSIRKTIAITNERRAKQSAYNREHGITPRSIVRAVQESLSRERAARKLVRGLVKEWRAEYEVTEAINQLEKEMKEAADRWDFERAAEIRDQIYRLTGKGRKRKK